ncbi:MAG: DUF3078 domain-containing protein [Bacteroidetes bacterium]|nr:DUF3078 domain-containing protein [Bacteroidota bacterium]MBS1633911.1 DUF3078 domain-containing protein [Bacteroidota bacterium]
MKISYVIVVSFLFISGNLFAQDPSMKQLQSDANKTFKKDPADTTSGKWKTGGLYNLNLNQGALKNWAAGGDKSSLSVATLLALHAYYKNGKHQWDNSLEFAYGFINTTSLGSRKADDRIDLVSKYGYALHKQWFLSALFNLRSQFSKGYTYPSNNPKVLTSDFFAPAYILLSPGISYQPCENFSIFLSPVTARWVIVNNDSLSAAGAYGVDPGKKSKLEVGAFASASYKTNLSKTASFQGRLDLFSNYQHDPLNIDIYWTNMLLVKVTKIITMNLNLDLVYDNDIKTVKSDGNIVGASLQLKELMGIGLAVKF